MYSIESHLHITLLRGGGAKPYKAKTGSTGSIYRTYERVHTASLDGSRYPTDVLHFSNNAKEINNSKRLHPTQKPVDLLEYLIKTYSNVNETVLDFTMGVASTGIACLNTDRHFIGIELDKNYFELGKNRLENAVHKQSLTAH